MTYCSEMQRACEYATFEGDCPFRTCVKLLFTPGGWPIEQPKSKFVTPPMTNKDGE